MGLRLSGVGARGMVMDGTVAPLTPRPSLPDRGAYASAGVSVISLSISIVQFAPTMLSTLWMLVV